MAESRSIPGEGAFLHEAGDTFVRTITLSVNAVPVDLTGAAVEILVSQKEDGAALATLTLGQGLVASNLAGGEIKTFWQTAGILRPGREYYYKVRVTFPNGRIKTYLEDKFNTR
jgi:hypothetical protein